MPAARHLALSSTLLAGRGAGRGGSSSADVIGRTISTGWPDARRISCTNSNHVTAPGVREVEDARAAFGGDRTERRGEVGRERRAAPLVVDERQVGARRREAQHELDHVVAVLAADPRRPHDGRVRTGQPLTGELRDPVHRLRVRRVVLAVRAIERAVEDVVGADMDEMGADLFGGRRNVADGVGVDRSGDLDVRLTRVDGGVRRGVDDGIRPGGRGSPTGRPSRSVMSSAAWSTATTSSPAARAFATTSWPSCPPAPVTNSLTVSPRSQAHRPALDFSGSHQSRCSRYHSTVEASESSKLRLSDHPRAVILSMFTE